MTTSTTNTPQFITRDGLQFHRTGKTGTRFDSGHEVSEYRYHSEGLVDLRFWLDHEDGTIYED